MRVEAVLLGELGIAVRWPRTGGRALDVEEWMTVAQVMTAAGARLGAQWPGAFIAFDEQSRDRDVPELLTVLPTVDARGVATFRQFLNEVRYGEVVAAAQSGVLPVNPRRLWVPTQPGMGNGVVGDWPTLVEALKILWEVLSAATTVYGTWELGRVIRGRARAAPDAIDRHCRAWASRNGDLYDVFTWLTDRGWDLHVVASALDCDPSDAAAVLHALGFAPEHEGRWRAESDVAAAVLRQVAWVAVHGELHLATREQLERWMSELLAETMRTGAPAPVDWQQLQWLEPPPEPKWLKRTYHHWLRRR